jgi:hypothetical protein
VSVVVTEGRSGLARLTRWLVVFAVSSWVITVASLWWKAKHGGW